LWKHLETLYKETQAESGLYIGNHLKYEHIHFASFSKMKVNLAAQVLSSSISSAFEMLDSDEYKETATFCYMKTGFLIVLILGMQQRAR
jgi:hypothetical protein